MDKPWKVVVAFIGVFIAGAVFGGLFTLRASGKRIASTPPPVAAVPAPSAGQPKAPPHAGITLALMRQFTQRLHLTSAQRDKIRPLVGRAAEDLQRLRRENLENTTRVMERLYADVGAWLTPGQRAELEDMRQKTQERLAEERKKQRVDGPPPGARKDAAAKPAVVRPPGS